MTLAEIVKTLKPHEEEIKKRFKVKDVAIFGSYVREEQKQGSDIDIFVEFEQGYKTFDNYMDLKFFLEETLDAKIDLVIKSAIREEIKPHILSEAIYV